MLAADGDTLNQIKWSGTLFAPIDSPGLAAAAKAGRLAAPVAGGKLAAAEAAKWREVVQYHQVSCGWAASVACLRALHT